MAINSKTTFNLSSGFQITAFGFGISCSTTGLPPDPAKVENAVKTALQTGYRHLDCAPVYQDQAAVGRGIRASGIPREEIFNTGHDPLDVGPALDNTLKELDIEYVDLYLIHWPTSSGIHVTAWGPLTLSWTPNLNVANDPKLMEIAKTVGIRPAQLAISWAVQRGTSVIPRSWDERRIRENFEVVELPREVLEEVDRLG